MTAVAIISGITALILLLLFIFHCLEIKNIKKQIHELLDIDSNELIHSKYGGSIDTELINAINTLLTEMRRSRSVYQKKSHDLEQMMTNISHDLRTPLTSAMGYIDIIISSDLPEEEKEKEICIVGQRLKRLEELINSFFELSKIISGGRKPETENLNLVGILQEAIVHYYDDFCGQNREIVFVCDKASILVESSRSMLMRIFDNLIGNAYKHGVGDLKVTVTEADKTAIRFENRIYDDDMDVSRIFDEFYTTDISRTKGNTGLGLAIAKQFTEILGGSISAEYDGETFAVTIILTNSGT